jgi:hypothetical protein
MPTLKEKLNDLMRDANNTAGTLNLQIAYLRGHAGNHVLTRDQLVSCMYLVANSLQRLSEQQGVWEKV